MGLVFQVVTTHDEAILYHLDITNRPFGAAVNPVVFFHIWRTVIGLCDRDSKKQGMNHLGFGSPNQRAKTLSFLDPFGAVEREETWLKP